MMSWKLSRYWNRAMFMVMILARRFLWDQTGRNADIIGWLDAEIETVKGYLT